MKNMKLIKAHLYHQIKCAKEKYLSIFTNPFQVPMFL